MLLSVASIALAMAAGQSEPSRGQGGVEGSAAPAEERPSLGTFPEPSGFLDGSGLSGVPYIPSPGDLPRLRVNGAFLDLALQSTVRTQTLTVADATSAWGTDLEVTPGLALVVETPVLGLSVGYAPRFTVPFRTGAPELAILNRGTLRASWQPDPLWTLGASGTFTWGDYSQLAPATTPGGAGPPPPTLDPVRSFDTYPYVGIDTLLTVERMLSPRGRVRLGGGYFDVGGVGTLGQASQPRAWGPLAEAAYAWEASRASTLTTGATYQRWFFLDDPEIFTVTLTESWRQAWTSDLETTITAGPGYSNREVEGPTGAHQLVPVGGFRLDYRPESRHPVALSLAATLAPYVDVYTNSVAEQFTVRGAFDWRPSDAWHLGASLTAALASATPSSPGSYGTAGASASYAPTRFLILSLGGYSQAQFRSQASGATVFWQWSGYFSLAIRDRFSL